MGAESDQVTGKVEEAVGSLTGNEDLESQGKADRHAGEVKERLEHAKETIEKVVDKAEEKLEKVVDKAKDTLHRK